MAKKVSISQFLDDQGRIKQLPAPNRTKLPVLTYLAGKFETDKYYTEPEVNSIISKWHTFNDFFILRRLLVDLGYMGRVRDGSRYWIIESEHDENGQEKGS